MDPLLPPLLSAAVFAAGMTCYAEEVDRKEADDREDGYPSIDEPSQPLH